MHPASRSQMRQECSVDIVSSKPLKTFAKNAKKNLKESDGCNPIVVNIRLNIEWAISDYGLLVKRLYNTYILRSISLEATAICMRLDRTLSILCFKVLLQCYAIAR